MFIILKTELRISTTGKHVYEIELLELKPRKTTKLSRLIRYKFKGLLENTLTGLQNIVLFHYKRVTNLYLLVCLSNLFVCVQ